MKEQKIIITDKDSDINAEINRGWLVESVTAQHVSTSSSGWSNMYGKFCFVLVKNTLK